MEQIALATGYILKLEPSSWELIDKKARNAIRKAKKTLQVREGTLSELKLLHWNPVYLPRSLNLNQRIFTATLDSQPVSCVLATLKPEEKKIYYSYAGSDEAYNEYNGNSLLIWHIAEQHFNSTYRYFDLGGSAKEKIEKFKAQFGTETYKYKKVRSSLSSLRFRITRWLPYRIDRLTQPGGRIQRIIQDFQLHEANKHPTSNRIIHVGCDDPNMRLEKTKESLKVFTEIHDSYPDFRVTFFTVPWHLHESEWIINYLKERWINVGLHGYRHTSGELWDKLSISRMNYLLKLGVDEMRTIGLKPVVFKPPKYLCTPEILKPLKEASIMNAFLSNNQFNKLTYKTTKVNTENSLALFPTNFSVWRRDKRRLNSILNVNGYASIQTHVADMPKRKDDLIWILENMKKEGKYVFEDFNEGKGKPTNMSE